MLCGWVGNSEHCSGREKRGLAFGLNIFYFLNKYDNISIHCNLQITGSERKQEYYIGPLLVNIHCNAVITRVTGARKSNRVISDTPL